MRLVPTFGAQTCVFPGIAGVGGQKPFNHPVSWKRRGRTGCVWDWERPPPTFDFGHFSSVSVQKATRNNLSVPRIALYGRWFGWVMNLWVCPNEYSVLYVLPSRRRASVTVYSVLLLVQHAHNVISHPYRPVELRRDWCTKTPRLCSVIPVARTFDARHVVESLGESLNPQETLATCIPILYSYEVHSLHGYRPYSEMPALAACVPPLLLKQFGTRGRLPNKRSSNMGVQYKCAAISGYSLT